MEISEVSTQHPAYDQRSYSASVSVAFTTDFTLRTNEGDLVNISFRGEQSQKESKTQTQGADNAAVQKISSVAVAASQYSISVQGDLNDNELQAIQRLVDKIGPIARGFFAQGKFDSKNATQALTGSLDVLKEITLKLERAITATFSTQAVSPDKPAPVIDPQTVTPPDPSQEPVNTDKIRNLSDLISSAVGAEFQSQAAQAPKGESILRSLNDLILFLQEQLGKFLNPLQNSAEPALKPLPQEVQNSAEPAPKSLPQGLGTDFSPSEKPQA